MEPFTIKHYSSDERPTIKGNGFDGLEIGEDQEEAEAFIEFVNEHIKSLDDFTEEELIEVMDNLGYDCVKQNPSGIQLGDLYELKRTGKTAEFDTAFADYCWQEIGRIL